MSDLQLRNPVTHASQTDASINDMNVLKHIKQSTRQAHDKIERVKLLSNLFEQDYDIYSYTKLLSASYGFYLPAEARIRTLQQSTAGFDSVSKPNKALLIRKDLLALGMTRREIDSLPICYSSGARDKISAMAVSYVFEGATLGGKVISKRLDNFFGDDVAEARNFYGCYGSDCAPHWALFQNELVNVIGQDDAACQSLIATAQQTFESMTRWFENYQ